MHPSTHLKHTSHRERHSNSSHFIFKPPKKDDLFEKLHTSAKNVLAYKIR